MSPSLPVLPETRYGSDPLHKDHIETRSRSTLPPSTWATSALTYSARKSDVHIAMIRTAYLMESPDSFSSPLLKIPLILHLLAVKQCSSTVEVYVDGPMRFPSRALDHAFPQLNSIQAATYAHGGFSSISTPISFFLLKIILIS